MTVPGYCSRHQRRTSSATASKGSARTGSVPAYVAARTSDADQKRRLRPARLEPTPFGVDLEPESLERFDAEQRI